MNQLGDDPRETGDDDDSLDIADDELRIRVYRGHSRDDRTLALCAHASGLVLSFLGPLTIWFLKRGHSAYVADQAREALNFQLTLLAAMLFLMSITGITCGFGVIFTAPLIAAMSLANIGFSIVACVRANHGDVYRYPMNLRVVQPASRSAASLDQYG